MLLFFQFFKVPTIQVVYKDSSYLIKERTFSIGWIHSVEKEPWFEEFERRQNKLYLTGTKFKTFGAGTPSEGEIIPSNDGFIHMKMEQEIPELRIFVSDNVKTTLYVNEKELLLYELMDDHESVVIKVQNMPLWQYLRGEEI